MFPIIRSTWALLIGIFFFNETLDYLSFIGILLIMFSGIFVLYRESKIKKFSWAYHHNLTKY